MELDPRETFLCSILDGVTRQAFGDELVSNPLYEVYWEGIKKKEEWKPALSLIPVKKEKSYGVNINILQRLKIRNFEDEIYGIYSAITPKDDHVIFLGVEYALLAKYNIPRGFYKTNGDLKHIKRGDDSESGKVNYVHPLYVAILTEFSHNKESRLLQEYNQIKSGGEYERYNLTSSSYFAIGPTHGQTMILTHGYVKPLKGPKQKIDVYGQKMKIQVGVPDPRELQKILNFSIMLSDYASVYAIDSKVESSVPNLGLSTLLMTFESVRRENFPKDPPVHLGEIYGTIKSSRREELMKIVLGTEKSEEEKQSDTQVPTVRPARVQKHRCPECSHVADYNYSSLKPDGSLVCISCRGKFTPSEENEVN